MRESPEQKTASGSDRTTAAFLFGLLLLGSALFHHPVEYDATGSRFLQLHAMADRGTLHIDALHSRTIDKSFGAGHYYPNKPPGAVLLGFPIYWVVRRLPEWHTVAPLAFRLCYIVRLLTTTVPFAFLGAVLFGLARRWGAPPWRAFLMTLGYAFGTIAWLHATLFNGHQIAASLGFGGTALLVQSRSAADASDRRRQDPPTRLFLAGFCAGWATITDYHAVILAVGLAVYLVLTRRTFRPLVPYCAGGAVPALILAWYNAVCFGTPFTLSYLHLVDPELRAEVTLNGPRPVILGRLLLSPARGLFVTMPVLLLGAFGLAGMIRIRRTAEALLFGSLATGFLLFNAAFGGWHAGWTFGPRYLTPVLPFLAFPMAFGRWSRFTWLVLFLPSSFQIAAAVAGVPHAPPDLRNPLVELMLPLMGYGYWSINLGTCLGLPPFLSAIFLLGFLGGWSTFIFRVACRDEQAEGARREPRALRLTACLATLVVICLLAFVRTPSDSLVHHYRSRLLAHAARSTQSAKLARAAIREAVLADECASDESPHIHGHPPHTR